MLIIKMHAVREASMKKITVITIIMFLLVASKVMALSSIPPLPDPTALTNGVPNAVQYGDFYSYSLPLLDYFTDGVPYTANDDWYVGAPSPNDDVIVVYTKSSSVDEINPAGMDQAYIAEDSAQDNSSFYITQTLDPSYPQNQNDPYVFPEFTGDTELYWDAQLSSLSSFLGESELVFFFNNNQKDSTEDDGFPLQNLFGWGQVQIVDIEGSLETLYFDFTDAFTGNDVTLYTNTGGAAPVNPNEDGTSFDAYQSYLDNGDFVLSGGDLCLSTAGSIYTGPCASGDTTLDHNLGLNTAAYALYSPEINDGLARWIEQGYDTFSFDMRLEYLNNGPEQLFIMAVPVEDTYVIPEPSALILLGTGILGLVFYRRKR